MNYVGQLAETVFVTVKELYRGLNPATLTGCIDVLVVRQPDGSYQCSPFHVRFGKLGVLRSKEKVVDIEINGEPVDLHMKLGDNGEAFFVQETETSEEKVPSHLSTSPLPLEDPEDVHYIAARSTQGLAATPQLSPIKDPEATGSETSVRKKKRRRKKLKAKESPKREDAERSSDDHSENELSLEEKHKPLSTSSIYYSSTDISVLEASVLQSKERYPSSDGEYTSAAQSFFLNRPSSPKTDSELEIKSSDLSPGRAESHMQWNWGTLPQVSKLERAEPLKSSQSDHSTIARYDSIITIWPSDTSCFRTISTDSLDDHKKVSSEEFSGHTPLLRPEPLFHCICRNKPESKAETVQARQPMAEEQSLDAQKPLGATGGEESNEAKEEAFKLVLHIEEIPGTSQMEPEGTKIAECDARTELKPGNHDRKGSLKKNQHQTASDIYLDDIIKLDAEDIALYFPKSSNDVTLPSKSFTDASTCSLAHQPGNNTNDSGVEYFSDPTELVDNIMLSLCGGLGDSREIQHEKFMQHLLSYDMLAENPAILDDPNLVVQINNKYYNWAVAAPMILSLQAFQKNLPKSTIDKLVKEKMPKKSGRWWFSWRRKDFSVEENEATAEKDEAEQSKVNTLSKRKKKFATSSEDESANQEGTTTQPMSQEPAESLFMPTYKKSLRLSSEQISCLNLKDGANNAAFSVTTQYQGTCRCEATIYLWNWDDKIVISDIDGTITKSDALGHILPHLGKDWTHRGIATLYHRIHINGYKFLYCSARSIGMSELTKMYLHWVNDQGCELPKGPVLLAPSSLLSALHREMIEKKPEVFKIACLTDIKNLFGPQQQPFYAAFGNKRNDVYAYQQVGLPESRIFTVNPKGEVILELTKTKSSYNRLSELVELIFPPLPQTSAAALLCPEFNSFPFWRDPVPTFSLEGMVDSF